MKKANSGLNYSQPRYKNQTGMPKDAYEQRNLPAPHPAQKT